MEVIKRTNELVQERYFAGMLTIENYREGWLECYRQAEEEIRSDRATGGQSGTAV